ncbi:MAG: AAA family ATPase, partial [Atopobiaceae bacterium]|nr:AAA family ATPase [Atopobiaceae bacterium]
FVSDRFGDEIEIEHCEIDCSQHTVTGWRGGDISDHVVKVAEWQEKHPDELCMVVLEELDKIIKFATFEPSFDPQSNILRLLDGESVSTIASRNSVDKTVDMRRVILVGAGAFMGIEEVISKRLMGTETYGFFRESKSIAYSNDVKALRAETTIEDLIAYGIKAELAGRLMGIVVMPELEREALRQIINGYDKSLENRTQCLLGEGRSFSITDAAADYIVDKALELGVGARAIDQIASPFASKAAAEALDDMYAKDFVLDLHDEKLQLTCNKSDTPLSPQVLTLPRLTKTTIDTYQLTMSRLGSSRCNQYFKEIAYSIEKTERFADMMARYYISGEFSVAELAEAQTAAKYLYESMCWFIAEAFPNDLTLSSTYMVVHKMWLENLGLMKTILYRDPARGGSDSSLVEQIVTQKTIKVSEMSFKALASYARFNDYSEDAQRRAAQILSKNLEHYGEDRSNTLRTIMKAIANGESHDMSETPLWI